MLLKHLYDFAVRRKLLDDLAFRLDTPVRWVIHLDSQGKLLGGGPLETEGPRKNKGHEYSAPRTSRATNSGTVSDFLVDDIGAIFCLATEPGKPPNERSAQKLIEKHRDFWRQIAEAKLATGDRRFDALLLFKDRLGGKQPSFLRLDEKAAGWLVRTAGGTEKPLGSDLLTFSVAGLGTEILILDEAIRNHWRRIFAGEMQDAEEGSRKGLCLVTGDTGVPLARTHTPMVTGLPRPAKPTGAGIVGFESSSFRSYGFEKSYNAPTSVAAARGYLLALQFLSRRQDHWLSLGPSWFCFWAAETEQVSDIFARLLRRPDPLTVRKFMTSPWSGLEKPPPASDTFITVTLSATGPRIVIKNWVQMSLAEAAEHIKDWFNDLALAAEIEQSEGANATDNEMFAPLAISRLAGCSAPLTSKAGRLMPDYEQLQPDATAQLYRAAIEGTSPSVSLIKPILDQLHSKLVRDKNYQVLFDQSRFALLKLILNRKNRDMEIQPQLTANTDDAAYNCGRLLAILAAAQDKAHEFKLEGAGVAERYFGTASVSPASVFPLLLRLNRHHLNKISKSDRFGGHGRFIQQQIEGVLVLFKAVKPGVPPAFPRTLDLQSQGRFALGFYQQTAADHFSRKNKNQIPNPESETK